MWRVKRVYHSRRSGDGSLRCGRWAVVGFVDAQNGFGAQIRQDFRCEMTYSGERATLKKLTIGDTVLLDT
jgi:hypothetical protein